MEQKTKQKTKSKFLSLILSTKIPMFILSLGILGSLLTTVAGLAIPLLTRELVDGFSFEAINASLITLIIFVFILQAVIDGSSYFALTYVGQKIVANLRKKMWFKLIRMPVSYFDKNKSGEVVSRVVNDTGIVKDLISQQFPQFIGGLITLIGSVIILFIMDWQMTLLLFIAVPFTLLVMFPLGVKMSKVSRTLQDETAKFTSNIQQTLSEIRLMKASNAEQTEEKKGLQGIEKLFTTGLKEGKIFALLSPLIYMIVMFVIVIIIGYGGIRVSEGTMSTGSLVAFLLYIFQIIYPITSFTMFFTQLQKAKGATERLIEILEMDNEPGQSGIEMDIKDLPIEFEDVSFSYQEDEPILKNISFHVEPGTMVAFAGPSGGGKSTLFGLIERFYEPTSGVIRVGDTPIHEISTDCWRKQIGYVSQDSPMMAGTIRENLIYGLEDLEINDNKLWEVAKMAYADQFIKEFPQGLDTEVGERGVKLSGGQRQRIAIARAFLRNPKILMMDEATASLDSQSEGIVQKALARLMEGRTTFTIAHRLSTIVNADKIVFIEKGEITGMGTHQQLVETHPLYREFAEQQLAEQATGEVVH